MLTFLAGIAFSLLCFILLNAAMVPVSKSEYCGGKCHEMGTAYRTWELSSHGANNMGIRVECIDCHLPSKDKYFTHVAAKAYVGAKDIYKHYFGDEYDVEKMRQRVLSHMPNQRCLNCHDDLLTKPGSSASRIAHVAALANLDVPENKCVRCHEETGHQRQNKTFSK
jgi:trimethylamine-N-oxide reductase (cytochrome c) cytochrome c-type subunit TorY